MMMTDSEFFVFSSLCCDRRKEIMDWFNSLPEEQQRMIEDLRFDSREGERFDVEGEHSE